MSQPRSRIVGTCQVCHEDARVTFRGKKIVMATHPKDKDQPKCLGVGLEPMSLPDQRVKTRAPFASLA